MRVFDGAVSTFRAASVPRPSSGPAGGEIALVVLMRGGLCSAV
jgi:hypothetical protein